MLDTSYRRVPDKSWAAATGSSLLSLFILVHPQPFYVNECEHDGVDYWHGCMSRDGSLLGLRMQKHRRYDLASSRRVASSWDSCRQ